MDISLLEGKVDRLVGDDPEDTARASRSGVCRPEELHDGVNWARAYGGTISTGMIYRPSGPRRVISARAVPDMLQFGSWV